MTALVSIEEIRAAARRLDGVVVRTPLVPFPDTQPRLLVKPESLQPTGSFKLRGAFAAISALPPAQRERGVVAHTSGNHGLAVAYAARALGFPVSGSPLPAYGPGAVPPSTNCTHQQISNGAGGLPVG